MEALAIEAAIEAAIKIVTFIGNSVGNQQVVSDIITEQLKTGGQWTDENRQKVRDMVAAQKEYARKQLEAGPDEIDIPTP